MEQNPVEWMTELLKLMGYPPQVRMTVKDSGGIPNYWLEIDTSGYTAQQIQNLIGQDGSVIDAIQYLANAILNVGNSESEYKFYTVEIAGYRANRIAQLEKMAQEAAAWVRAKGKEYKIENLSAAERRQVHLFLQKQGDVITESVGKEPNRHLIIKPKS